MQDVLNTVYSNSTESSVDIKKTMFTPRLRLFLEIIFVDSSRHKK